LWGPWRAETTRRAGTIAGLLKAARERAAAPGGAARHPRHFTLFATDKKKRRIKVVCRYQQYEAVNLIVQRVLAGKPRKGLIWHFQGSGKSLLMVFAAQKLRCSRRSATPRHHRRRPHRPRRADQLHLPRLRRAQPREGRDARRTAALLKQDTPQDHHHDHLQVRRGRGVLNDRGNIVALVDEAHRTQEGDLGMKMRAALPNAFLFGLTGTPINRATATPSTPSARPEEDARGYMSRYGFEESIRDGATLKLHFEPRLVELHIDKAAIDQAYQALTGEPLRPRQGQPRARPPRRWRCW
jgi:type I restriction enzyme R subunit